MSYNGSGVYTLPGAQLVNGEVVSSTENNQFRNDVATALNVAWTRDGQAPATANIPMASHKLTGLSAGTNPGDSVRYEQATSDVNITGGTITGVDLQNPEYTGTLTGGTGVINIGSGQIYKTSGGNVGIGTSTPAQKLSVAGVIESTSSGFKFPDGTVQNTSAVSEANKTWTSFTSSGTYTVPASVGQIRVYAFGAGGNGSGYPNSGAGGGGGGCAYGDINVNVGDEVTVTISSGVATVSIGATTYLTANKGADAVTTTPGTGGTATKHASVTNGGAYAGGSGGTTAGGGGGSGSPLGIGGAGGNGSTGGTAPGGGGGYAFGGAGSAGNGSNAGGGSFGNASNNAPGQGRNNFNTYTDPFLASCFGSGGIAGGVQPGAGGGGGGANGSNGQNGGLMAGGGGAQGAATAGSGGIGGGGGGWYNGSSAVYNGGGGGGGTGGANAATSSGVGSGSNAAVYIYA